MGSLANQRVWGWGRQPVGETELRRPERLRDLYAAVSGEGTALARGLGRSYGDASFNSAGTTILMERIDRYVDFDPSAGVVECEAGVTIDDLVRHFVPRGFFPPVVPGTKHVTMGGAIASDIHGKNHHKDGSLARHLLDFELLTASGDIVTCSRDENPDLFWATLGGMGLTGVVTTLRMQMTPVASAYVEVDIDRAPDLDRTLELFHESDENYRYSVAWVDGLAGGRSLGRSILMRGNPAPSGDGRGLDVKRRKERSVPKIFPAALLNRTSVKAFNTLYYRRHPRQARGAVQHYEPFFFPLDAARDWNRLYGKRGFTQYQCVLPYEGGRDGLARILEFVRRETRGSFLTVLKRFGPGEADSPLSFPMPGYTLAMDIPWRGAALESALERIDAIVIELGGRVYLTKDARLSAESLRAMYDRLDEWLAVKRRVDPESRFVSDLGQRLGLVA
ncbi:MAG: FAD-binding oxidoreductase [Gemmatimonadetes bacterium]|uniref:FAD-binding oxidoreductase n=1 Tax=Candidatus Kutchimonas denitrificans TaxID=3056748 RepID=A0AAE5CD38_9BACT|nr:FAD-binding oxidoreductase [Gemmatimonadota bacterium]NIR76530.1 FAD-binding oxidoreductase [Candidatus Kutchimonas denitrificans]NIS03348.1 FAD-binding oxidoreductase [Gemmatimonadota bacterium]NIT69209.1 FAD-binding oxidoreductase [Gemmatimonadota bacterium]NIU54601.1 FAD-binding protein [Gemmatimonadota bacterium]